MAATDSIPARPSGAIRRSQPPPEHRRYRIGESIARGGMAEIFRAIDLDTGRPVAIKRLRGGVDPELLALFQREYQVLSQLRHPQIIQVFDYGVDAEGPYYAMELLAGDDVRRLAPLNPGDVCGILRDVASSLALLHARRFVHRDVSAGNVRRTPDGRCKLLDFGAMAPFGRSATLVGTPPYVPPEALQSGELDSRADLYSLGALGYFLCSGRHAYPSREIAGLPEQWAHPPVALSTLIPDVPTALGELVMALLSQDVAARPASAAEVIYRLDGITGGSPDGEHDVAASYLASPGLVGRDAHLRRIGDVLASVAGASGSVLVLEGTSGSGKTRVLGEVVVAAGLRGLTVARADGGGGDGAYAVVRTLGAAVLRSLDARSLAAARTRGGLVRRLVPALSEHLPAREIEELPDDAAETRARMQSALLEWFLAIAAVRPLVLCVDNLERVDESSAAILATLASRASEHPIALVCAFNPDATSASPGVTLLLCSAERVPLERLDSEGTALLFRSLFGDGPNVAGLAMMSHTLTLGNPLACMAVARHLVAEGVAAYSRGSWALAREVLPEDLPASIGEAFSRVLRSLSPDARRVADFLSIARSDLRVGTLSRVVGQACLAAALDELSAGDIVTSAESGYRIAQGSLRKTLRLELADGQKDLHRALGLALMQDEPDELSDVMDAGWHLYYGGEENLGAELLERAAAGLADAGAPVFGSIPALEVALHVSERSGKGGDACLRIRTALVNASYYFDRDLATRYGVETLEMLLSATGLARASSFSRVLGPKHGLIASVALKAATEKLKPRSRRGPGIREAMALLFRAGQAVAAVSTYCLDAATVKRLVERLSMLAGLPDDHPGRLFYDHYLRLLRLTEGREGEAYLLTLSILQRLDDPKLYPKMTPGVRERIRAGMLFTAGVLESFRGDRQALTRAGELATMHLTYFHDLVAQQLQMLCFAHRGELDEAHRHRASFELQAVRVGAAWQSRVWTPAAMGLAYFNCGNVVDFKGCLDQLEVVSKDVPTLGLFRRTLETGYVINQGRPEEALRLHEALLPELRPREHIGWARFYAAGAWCLNELGQHERARSSCHEALQHVQPEDRQFPALYLALEQELCVAEAGLKRTSEAARRADALIRSYESFDSALVRGSLEGTRARVALLARDHEAFRRHHANMERLCRATGNSTVIESANRLAQLAARQHLTVGVLDVVAAGSRVGDRTRSPSVDLALMEISQLDTARARGRRALSLLLQAVESSWGLLYLMEEQRFVLTASSEGAVATERMETRIVQELGDDVETEVVPPEGLPHAATEEQELTESVIGLYVRERHPAKLVGAFVTRGAKAQPLALFDALARALDVEGEGGSSLTHAEPS